MLAKITAPVWISGTPRAIGETVEVSAAAFASLARAGKVASVDAPCGAAETEPAPVQPENREKPLHAKRQTR